MDFSLVGSDEWGSNKSQVNIAEEYGKKVPNLFYTTSKKCNKRKNFSEKITREHPSDDQLHKKKFKKCNTKNLRNSNCNDMSEKKASQKTNSSSDIIRNDSTFSQSRTKKKKKRKHTIPNVLNKVKNNFTNVVLGSKCNISQTKTFSKVLDNKAFDEAHVPQKRKKKLSHFCGDRNKETSYKNLASLDSDSHDKEHQTSVKITHAANISSFSRERSAALHEKALKTVQAAKFRLLNEKLYTISGRSAFQYFQENEDAFHAYHQGYQNQVSKWPVNPVDLIIKDLHQLHRESVIADLGCGDAKIARSFPKRKIHSFDLVAINEYVTCCDISKVPLADQSVDVAVFCLSLMGINLNEYVREAYRILKIGGLLKIAEVESRIDDLLQFTKNIEAYGFTLVKKDISHKMFILLDFNKIQKSSKKVPLPKINLNPCLYKKR